LVVLMMQILSHESCADHPNGIS